MQADGLIVEDAAPEGIPKMRRARRVYQLTDAGKQRFAELVADTGPQNYTDDGFGVHLAFFNRTPAEARMRILGGRRRQVEERREGLREAVARASSSLDRYTRQLHQLGLESSEREVKWLNELIAAERTAQGRAEQPITKLSTTRSKYGEERSRHDWKHATCGSQLSASATARPRWCRVCSTTRTPTRTRRFPV